MLLIFIIKCGLGKLCIVYVTLTSETFNERTGFLYRQFVEVYLITFYFACGGLSLFTSVASYALRTLS